VTAAGRRIHRRAAGELSNLSVAFAFQGKGTQPTGEQMSTFWKLAASTALVALAAAPAFAAPPADKPTREDNPGAVHRPAETPPPDRGREGTPGPTGSLPAQAKAYGRHCQGQSKKRSDAAEGTKGTPFSQCVRAMAKLAKGTSDSPRKACKDLSKKHVEGEKGTPYSRCVVAGAKLLREQRAQNQG
jgi:hypothetical protein